MRHAALLLTILIVGCSGCARHVTPSAPPAPVVLPLAPCHAPAAPALPPVDGEMPLDSPGNVRTLLDRDSTLRRYIAGLRAALACYDAQTGGQDAR